MRMMNDRRVNNRTNIGESTLCSYCGKTITCGFVRRANCNSYCNRKTLFFKGKTFTSENPLHAKFVKYMLEMIKTQPIIYYKGWEKYLRKKEEMPIPDEIMDLINSNEPLPIPTESGIGSLQYYEKELKAKNSRKMIDELEVLVT
jgi:hypothetical protein